MTDYASRLSDDGFCVFLFHGVIDGPESGIRNYTRKHLPAGDFRKIIRGLVAAGTAVSMDDIADARASGNTLPARSFAITFDDGFENNATIAAPILRDLAVPATIYVTTGFVEHNWMSWIDRIENRVSDSPPFSLRLPWRSHPATAATPNEKIALMDEVRARAKSTGGLDLHRFAEDVIDQLRPLAPPSPEGTGALYRKMSWRQVAELDADPLFIVGGHSHSHPILSFLEEEALVSEIDTSLALLRDRAGVTTCHYSYPEGLAHCYSARVIEALKMRGISCCPTAIDGINAQDADLFELRRITVV